MGSPGLPSWLEDRLPSVDELHQRLRLLIPKELDPEGFALRELSAKVVFVMLYGFAIEGLDRWIRPTAVADMTDLQGAKSDAAERRRWLKSVQSRSRPRNVEGRWYEENSRESIRDETLRRLIELGLVIERTGLATTSPKPRYALASTFVELCSPSLTGEKLASAAQHWRESHLSTAALTRLALIRKGATGGSGVLVELPNREIRRIAPGPSADLTKAAVEVFAPRFLVRPAVVLISESAKKISFRDEELLRLAKIEIDQASTLPDLVLLDVGTSPPLLVFVECVATAGEVNERRRGALEAIARYSGYKASDCAFVSVFHDRVASPYKAASVSLAWGSFVWFETEPDHLIFLRDGKELPATSLAALLSARRE